MRKQPVTRHAASSLPVVADRAIKENSFSDVYRLHVDAVWKRLFDELSARNVAWPKNVTCCNRQTSSYLLHSDEPSARSMIRRPKFTVEQIDGEPVKVFGPARNAILKGVLVVTDRQPDGAFECSIALPDQTDFAKEHGLRSGVLNDYFFSKLRFLSDGDEFHLHLRTSSDLEEFLRISRRQI